MYPVTVWRPAKVGLLDVLPSDLDGALVDLSPLHLGRHPDGSHLQVAQFKSTRVCTGRVNLGSPLRGFKASLDASLFYSK